MQHNNSRCRISNSGIRVIFVAWSALFTLSSHAGDLRVTTKWLHDQRSSPTIAVLDTRDHSLYIQGHIPGAVSFPNALTYQSKDTGGRIAGPDIVQNAVRERGINVDDTVVVYDDGRLMDAARVLWVLEAYGFKNVKILDGGFADWINNLFETSMESQQVTPSQYVSNVDASRIATKLTTRLASLNEKQYIIDARRPDDYHGRKSTARRYGHIPRAINIPFTENISDANGASVIRSIGELRALYKKIPEGAKVVVYCSKGLVSSTSYLVLRELGYDVANYDASWNEWGNDDALPVEK